jgi:hypothetical protein
MAAAEYTIAPSSVCPGRDSLFTSPNNSTARNSENSETSPEWGAHETRGSDRAARGASSEARKTVGVPFGEAISGYVCGTRTSSAGEACSEPAKKSGVRHRGAFPSEANVTAPQG